MGCTCSDQSRTLRVQGEELFNRAELLGTARHMLRMDELIAQAHKDVRRVERAALLNQPLSGGVSVSPEVRLEQARRHASQARREFRTALSSDAWSPVLRGFDSRRDDFASALTEQRALLLEGLDAADVGVQATGEIAAAFDEIATVAREQGTDGLLTFFDEQMANADTVLTADRDWGREERSPLEWWQWLIIIGVLVISIAALIVCLWWFGCSWISAIWAAFCWGTVAAGGFWAGICLGFGF